MTFDWSWMLVAAYGTPLAMAVWWQSRRSRPRATIWLLLLALPLFYAVHYHGSRALIGWPTHEPLPEQFELIAEEVAEPAVIGARDGYIRLWVRTAGSQRSRLHELPYSRETHEKLAAAAKRRAAGRAQVGSAVSQRKSGRQEITFADAPRAAIPAKAPAPLRPGS